MKTFFLFRLQYFITGASLSSSQRIAPRGRRKDWLQTGIFVVRASTCDLGIIAYAETSPLNLHTDVSHTLCSGSRGLIIGPPFFVIWSFSPFKPNGISYYFQFGRTLTELPERRVNYDF